MGTPQSRQREPQEWKKAAAKFDLERLGLEILNEYIALGRTIEGLNLENYKNLLLKHTSRPYIGLGLNVIRVRSPQLSHFNRFKLGWEKEIQEPEDEFGNPFNPKERAKRNNYDPISVEGKILDWMYIWRQELKDAGDTTETLCGVIKKITWDSFEYIYRNKRTILLRPPMQGEINWGNDMIELIAPYAGYFLDKYYKSENGVARRIYKRRFIDGYPCRKHKWLKKLWGR